MFMVWGLPWILQIFDSRDRICGGGGVTMETMHM